MNQLIVLEAVEQGVQEGLKTRDQGTPGAIAKGWFSAVP